MLKATSIAHVLQQLDHTHIYCVRVGSSFCNSSAVIDAQLLIANPKFDSLHLPNCNYNRTDQSLQLSLHQLTEADVVGLLNILPVVKLTVVDMSFVTSPQLVSTLGTTVGNSVKELELVNCSDQQLTIALLSKCPNLKSVNFGHQVAFNADIVTVLSTYCKDLKCIEIYANCSPSDFVKLLTGCCGLTDIKLVQLECITANMLQAVVESGTVRTLSWMKSRILPEEDLLLSAFREQFRERQTLPVPRMLMYDSFFDVCEQYDVQLK